VEAVVSALGVSAGVLDALGVAAGAVDVTFVFEVPAIATRPHSHWRNQLQRHPARVPHACASCEVWQPATWPACPTAWHPWTRSARERLAEHSHVFWRCIPGPSALYPFTRHPVSTLHRQTHAAHGAQAALKRHADSSQDAPAGVSVPVPEPGAGAGVPATGVGPEGTVGVAPAGAWEPPARRQTFT
jgi:hypothetical protein